MFDSILLVVGVFAASSSVLMIRWSDEHPLLLASFRLLLAVLFLLPPFFRDLKRRGRLSREELRPVLLPGLVLGLHFIAWIVGARMTPAANATLLVNMSPAAMPLIAPLLYGEKLNAREALGTAVALAGVAILGVADFRVSGATLKGDLLCFFAMLLFTVYLALARKNRGLGSIWLYVVPLYSVAGLFCLAVSLFFVNPIKPYTLNNALNIAALALGPTIVGHTALNFAMRRFRGQVVAVVNLAQFVFAGVMGYLWLGETPAPSFYASSALVAGGAAIAILFGGRGSKRDGAAEARSGAG